MLKETLLKIQREILIPELDRLHGERGELSALAQKLERQGFLKHAQNRLAELRSGKRNLSLYFLNIMIDGGVMEIKQIFRGRAFGELSEAEKEIVLRLKTDAETLLLVWEAEQNGLDVKQLLKIHLKKQ